MKRKESRNYVSMHYRIDELPKRKITRQEFFSTVLHTLRTETPLPAGWHVTWLWRNTSQQAERSDSLENVVKDSRSSFVGLMIRHIEGRAQAAISDFVPSEIKRKRKLPPRDSKGRFRKRYKGEL